MVDDALFPLYVFEKDDWSMFLVETPNDILRHIEPFDFENEEYLFWDSQGRGVRLTLRRGKLTDIEETTNQITVREAFDRYSQALGVTVDTKGVVAEVWARLQANVKPPSRSSRIAQNVLGWGCLLVVLVVAAFAFILVGGVVKAVLAR